MDPCSMVAKAVEENASMAAAKAQANRRVRRRPGQARSVVTVAALLDAVDDLARGHKVDTLTVRQLADRAGISKGSLYEYFPSLDAVIFAWESRCYERGLAKIATLLEEIYRTQPGSAPALRRVVLALVDLADAHYRLYTPGGGLRSRVRERHERREEIIAFVRGALDTLTPPEEVRPGDRQTIARTFVHALFSTIHAYVDSDLSDPEKQAWRAEIAELGVRYVLQDDRSLP